MVLPCFCFNLSLSTILLIYLIFNTFFFSVYFSVTIFYSTLISTLIWFGKFPKKNIKFKINPNTTITKFKKNKLKHLFHNKMMNDATEIWIWNWKFFSINARITFAYEFTYEKHHLFYTFSKKITKILK